MKGIGHDILVSIVMGVIAPAVVLRAGMLIPVEDVMGNKTDVISASVVPEKNKSNMQVLFRSATGEVNLIDMDEYLVGAVLAEMPAYFESEALKAQAVAARTYARKAYITGGKHGDGSVCWNYACCQAYISETDYLDRGGSAEDVEKVRQAVYGTSDQVLTYKGELIEATYFSCSGGKTEDAAAVWGTDYEYLRSVESPGEEGAVYFYDSKTFLVAEIENILGVLFDGPEETWISDILFTEGGGVDSMVIGGVAFRGTELRNLLGLRSTAFSAECSSTGITFHTRGYGHRVGMSQYGADAMAVLGHSYQQILAHYYPETSLEIQKG